jgi:hypothetical protein
MKITAFIIFIFCLVSCQREKLDELILKTPTNLSISKGDFPYKILIKWDSMAFARHYQIFRYDKSLLEYKLLKQTDSTIFYDFDFPLTEKQFYKVRIFNSESSFSDFSENEYGFTANFVGPDALMTPPIKFNASKGIFATKILLNWSRSSLANNYQVFRLDSKTNNYIFIASTADTLYEDKSVTIPNNNIYYKVRVFNSGDYYSNFSNFDYGYVTADVLDLINTFGSLGSNPGQFTFPEHLSIDKNDNIYVSDPSSNKIQKFDKDGNFLEVFLSFPSPRSLLFLDNLIIVTKSADYKICEMDYNKQIIREWGSEGTGSGQFNYFRQITIDDEKNLYVVDHNNHRIQKFDLNGNFLLQWGGYGETQGEFIYPWGIAYINNKILVSSHNGVQFFTKDGTFIKQFHSSGSVADIRIKGDDIYLACNSYILKTNENRTADLKIGSYSFSGVMSIVISSNGNLYGADLIKRKIFVFKNN